MKKLSLLLVFLLIICLFAGCGGEKVEDDSAKIKEYLPTDTALSDKNVDFIGRFKEVDGAYHFAY